MFCGDDGNTTFQAAPPQVYRHNNRFAPRATAPHSWTEGNFDGDDDIVITDFNFLAANFAPDGYGASAVPEPSSLLLALLGLMLLAGARVQ